MKIEVEGQDGWKEVEGVNEWSDITDLGWEFLYLTCHNFVAMKRDGFINFFRNKPEAKE